MGQDGHKPIRLGILEDFLGLRLRMAYERSWQDFAAALGPDAMRPGYFTMLTLIALNPGINQTQIGRMAGRDKSGVAKALRWMEDEGLILRERPGDNRRTQVVSVTEKGAARQAQMERAARDHLNVLETALGKDRKDELLVMLHDIVNSLPDRTET